MYILCVYYIYNIIYMYIYIYIRTIILVIHVVSKDLALFFRFRNCSPLKFIHGRAKSRGGLFGSARLGTATAFSGSCRLVPKEIWQWVKTNSTPVVHIKIAGKWMFIPLKMVLIGIDS